MNIIRRFRQKTACILLMAMLVSLVPIGDWGLITAQAANVGTALAPITVTDIYFNKLHTGVSVTEATLTIMGDGFANVPVRIDLGGGPVVLLTKDAGSDNNTLIYKLTQTQAASFTGTIRISNTTLQLVQTSFPFISAVDKQVVNKDLPDSLTLTGGGLNRINNPLEPNITATYGRGTSVKPIVPVAGGTASSITFIPPADTVLGSQDITIKETRSITVGIDPVPIATVVQSTYTSPFRVVKNLILSQLSMFPNSAAKGETVSITSTDFPSSSGYQVYFLGPNEDYSTVNKSPSVVLSADRKKLTVKVPTGALEFGSKTVKVVDTIAGEMVSEATVPGTFNLIDGANGPIIDDIAPNSGTDTGSSVSIKGRNLLTPVFPDLNWPATVAPPNVTLSINKQDLRLSFSTTGLTYQGVQVTSASRTVKAIIGASATFEEDAGGAPRYIAGQDDFLFIKTSPINDAATDPKKDVILEITTTIVADQTYVYNQTAVRSDGYTFISSSLKPGITKISPNQVHIDLNRNMKENTLISIEGTDFMVNKWTDSNGVSHLNYPVVLIQKINSLGTGDFTLMFDKNGNPANLTGRIYYKDSLGVTQTLKDASNNEVPVEMVVLDANNKVVDGTVGNEIGTRIVLYLPKLAQIDAEAKRHVKVFNPKRNDDNLGSETIALDALDFVMEPTAPILESVSPNIVTVDGGEEVTITGSTSIEEGAKVYIDGKEVTGFTRAIDLTGNKVILKFKAPKGRLGKTQLAVINPLGGLAVREFYYVQSFNKDPQILTVAPDKGTENTLVVIGGDNFFKPDPSVATEAGMDAFRLVGTRVLIEGQDVNQYYKGSYGEIIFKDYIASANKELLKIIPDPLVTARAQVADYGNSIILKSATGFYTLTTQFDGTIRLSNGQQNNYTIRLNDGKNGFEADKDGGATQPVTVSLTGIELDTEGIVLTMRTPYLVNTANEITGNRAQVISKNQIAFTVPRLITAGLKDVSVENPDTKRATKKGAFTYYDTPFPQPRIDMVDPATGSVSGGYQIAIKGANFENGSQVFIDGILVPAADTSVNQSGTVITVKVPKYSRNLADYQTDRITVPLVVVNLNAGSASLAKGFTYISPSKEPTLTKIQLNTGATNGGEIVELEGTNFNYYEPFKERDSSPGYSSGDTFTDINGNNLWDDLTTLSGGTDARLGILPFANGASYMFYDKYYSSPILPKVYFGTKQAQIVSYGKGKLTVVTPANPSGSMDVFIVNNDTGVSNKLKYTYKSSTPKVTYINPNQGARVGQENRDIYGTGFSQNLTPGYSGGTDGDAAVILEQMPRIEGLIRFADITNRKIAIGQPNDGKIGGGENAIVSLDGGLSILYDGANDKITVNLEENGKIYTRIFTNYDDSKLLIPAGMLKYGQEFYVPNGYNYGSSTYNTGTHYELFMVDVDTATGRFYVERGYAPRVKYDTATHFNMDTPSYYSVGKVTVTLFNSDGGSATTGYTYRNPASKPTIALVNPQTLNEPKTAWLVEASVKGGMIVEIKGHDFREGVKVYLDNKPMEVIEITTDTSTPTNPLEVIIARVPAGTTAEIGLNYPILVENTDGAIANSTDPKTLEPNDARPIYFVYRNPLSDPVITTVTPAETSIAGGNKITITGTDFRTGCIIIIGSANGVPVPYDSIDPRGTWATFTIPFPESGTDPAHGLTLGAKDIQVKNADFGMGIKANGLKIISYPKVTTVTTENGSSSVEWLSVEGGGKFRLTGTGFAEGAKVILGGTRAEKAAAATTTDPTGLWKNDKYYTVTGGILATSVQFVNATTLIVTAPAMTKEKDFTVTVLNADTGISDGDATVKYSVPVPSAPLNLDAEIVNDKYIKLFGYTSSNFDYFEIYTFIGDSTVSELKEDNYKDFHYLATAQTEPYKITRLDGIEDMDDDERVFIVLKAVNKYGPSSWSNIASLRYSKIDDIKGGLGVEDFDGNLDVPAGQAYGAEVTAQQAVVSISPTDLKAMTTVDMTGNAYSMVQNTIVNVPESVVASNYNRITLKMRQGQLGFNPAALNTAAFQGIARNDQLDTYANLRLEPVTTEYAGMIQRYIPRELKAFSQAYRVGTAASSNAGTTELYDRVGIMDLALAYQSTLPIGYNPYSLKLYWYDSAAYRWVPQSSLIDIYNRQVSSKASLPGVYIILGPR